jgi:hypothetical protein
MFAFDSPFCKSVYHLFYQAYTDLEIEYNDQPKSGKTQIFSTTLNGAALISDVSSDIKRFLKKLGFHAHAAPQALQGFFKNFGV